MHNNKDAVSPEHGHTPRELVRRQVEEPDYHVTDEDIENMTISDDITDEEKLEADEEGDSLENNRAGTSYDVLD